MNAAHPHTTNEYFWSKRTLDCVRTFKPQHKLRIFYEFLVTLDNLSFTDTYRILNDTQKHTHSPTQTHRQKRIGHPLSNQITDTQSRTQRYSDIDKEGHTSINILRKAHTDQLTQSNRITQNRTKIMPTYVTWYWHGMVTSVCDVSTQLSVQGQFFR